MTTPPPGKTIILLPGKSAIEDLFVKFTETLEAKGARLICQGLNGGMGRMQAEFIAAPAPALWLLTPWMFEGVDLPEGTVDRLIVKTLPFDHPSHSVFSRRSQHYRDPFRDYALPRLLHRLFRLLRTFTRIKTITGSVRVLDDRISTKEYGKKVRGYLEQFATKETGGAEKAEEAQNLPLRRETKAPRASPKKKSEEQLTLF